MVKDKKFWRKIFVEVGKTEEMADIAVEYGMEDHINQAGAIWLKRYYDKRMLEDCTTWSEETAMILKEIDRLMSIGVIK